MAVQVVRGETVFFFGESHVLGFAERIVQRGGAPPLMCHTFFLRGAVCFANVATPEGALCAPLKDALQFSRLFVDTQDDEPEQSVYVARSSQWRFVARQRFAVPPLVVLNFGQYDIFQAIESFPAPDFHLPELRSMHRLAGPFASRTIMGASDARFAHEWFAQRIAPFRVALARLRELGITRLATLAIPPPTLDEHACEATVRLLGGSGTPEKLRAAFRYKVALLLNALVREVCDAEDCVFLDSWPLLTRNGLLRPDVVLADEVHLNDRATDIILQHLIAPAAVRTSDESEIVSMR